MNDLISRSALYLELSKEASHCLELGTKTGVSWATALEEATLILRKAPAVDAVQVVRGHSIGDFCIYSFDEENASLAIVEIIRILNDERGVAEVKFHKVLVDDTGNGLFDYLLKSGKTMNASLKYLKNITPKGERRNGDACAL